VYRDETSIASDLNISPWSTIPYNAFNSLIKTLFCVNGVDRKRIDGNNVNEWGIDPPSENPSLAVSGTGLTGVYSVRYTYARKEGDTVVSESNPSNPSQDITLSNQGLQVTFARPADTQVTHIGYYRTSAGGNIYRRIEYKPLSSISGTTFTDNAADSLLGNTVSIEHDRPPKGTYVLGPNFTGLLFMIVGKDLYYCLGQQPEYWPTDHFIEVSSNEYPGLQILFHDQSLYWLTKRHIYLITGSTHGSFFPSRVDSLTGVQNQYGAVSIHGVGLFHTGSDGIYQFHQGQDKKITLHEFEPIFKGESVGSLPGVATMTDSWMVAFKDNIYLGYRGLGAGS